MNYQLGQARAVAAYAAEIVDAANRGIFISAQAGLDGEATYVIWRAASEGVIKHELPVTGTSVDRLAEHAKRFLDLVDHREVVDADQLNPGDLIVCIDGKIRRVLKTDTNAGIFGVTLTLDGVHPWQVSRNHRIEVTRPSL